LMLNALVMGSEVHGLIEGTSGGITALEDSLYRISEKDSMKTSSSVKCTVRLDKRRSWSVLCRVKISLCFLRSYKLGSRLSAMLAIEWHFKCLQRLKSF